MKFLCDRCKTRYSIGDERVRGKILKIRCKNCANVITVREGMADAETGAVGGRRTGTTQAVPLVQQAELARPTANGNGAAAARATASPSASNPNALGAAFATAMTKPPPALDEEWYVSIDGEQSGPFSLAEAQRWVAGRAFDADLHCWSEGFDDWLPVDKVSHFRGLRKKPAPAPAPPPLPPVRSGPVRAITAAPSRSMQAASIAVQQRAEEEPKPLFAATMASLERSAPAASGMNGGGMRVEARANGTAARPSLPPLAAQMPVPTLPTTLPAIKPSPTVKGVGLRPVTAPKPLGNFDTSNDAATQIESPAFTDEHELPTVRSETANGDAFVNALPTVRDADKIAPAKQRSLSSLLDGLERPETKDGKAQTGPNDAFFDKVKSEAETVSSPAAKPMFDNVEGSDDLDIGEVSRVVKLADLTKPKPLPKLNRTGAVPKLNGTGAVARINATAPVPLIDAVETVPSGMPLIADAPLEAVAPIVAASHRRGMIALIIGALVLIGAAVLVVVFVVNGGSDVTSLGSDYDYNGQRPDEVHRPGDPPIGSAEPPPNPFIPRPIPRPRPNPGSAKIIPDPPLGNSLKGDEIEAMARNSNGTTTACFRRADKGADAIRLADVKKIKVTFHINADGSVSAGSVKLSENGSETLTACIQRMIGGWKFRANAGGDFGFVFAKPE